jgi:hypothetical protein
MREVDPPREHVERHVLGSLISVAGLLSLLALTTVVLVVLLLVVVL